MAVFYSRLALWAALGLVGCDPGGFQPLLESGGITGTLVDAAGRPQTEVPVYLVQDGRAVSTARTQAAGRFVLPYEDRGPATVVLNDGRGYGAVASTLPSVRGIDLGRLTSQRLLTAFPQIVEWTGLGYDQRLTSGPGGMTPAFPGTNRFWLRQLLTGPQSALELLEWMSDGTVRIIKSDVRDRAKFVRPWIYTEIDEPMLNPYAGLRSWRRVSDDAVLLREVLYFSEQSQSRVLAHGENWIMVMLLKNIGPDEGLLDPPNFDIVFVRLSSDGSLRRSPTMSVQDAQYPCVAPLRDGRVAYRSRGVADCSGPWMVVDPEHIEAPFQTLEPSYLAAGPEDPPDAVLRNTLSSTGWWNAVSTSDGVEIVRWEDNQWILEHRISCEGCIFEPDSLQHGLEDWGFIGALAGEHTTHVISRDPPFVRTLPRTTEGKTLSTHKSTTGLWIDENYFLGAFAVMGGGAYLWMIDRDGQEKNVSLPFEICPEPFFNGLMVQDGYAYVRVRTNENECWWGRVSWDEPAELLPVSWVDGSSYLVSLSEDGQWFLQAAVDPVHGTFELFRARLPGGAQ